MIIEIKVANFRSIGAEQTLSFVADRATRHPDNLVKRPGYRLLKAVGLFGANASGKSNLVKAIGAMSSFVRDSATKMNDGDPILAAEPYRLDPEMRGKPSRFEITFVTDGTVYTYGFVADRERVHEEWLSGKSEDNDKTVLYIKRESDGDGVGGRWENLRLPGGIVELLKERTRENALFLSTAARENVKELLPAYRYIRDGIEIFDVSEPAEDFVEQTAMRCKSDAQLHAQVNSLLRDGDTGISNFDVQTVRRSRLSDYDADADGDRKPQYRPRRSPNAPESFHKIVTTRRDSDGETVAFDFSEEESNGTQRLFGLAGVLLNALTKGSFLVLDEIDASMHPLLTRRLLEMFQSPDANPNGAQLLFTTHDAVLLDGVLLRRDQIVLADKCGDASRFYSLADVVPPPPHTELFLRNYLAGRYGGTPQLGPAFDMLETGSVA